MDGAIKALFILAALIGIVVLGTSTVIRSLWHSEMKEEALPAEKAAAVATGS